MESKGRGSAVTFMCVAVMMLLVSTEIVHAAVYTVGPGGAWTYSVESWPKGKRFRAGDTLVFNYNPSFHNVVVVNKGGYSGCTAPRGAKVYQTGKDRIKLVKGQNYFICSFSGHCQSGMKIAVNAPSMSIFSAGFFSSHTALSIISSSAGSSDYLKRTNPPI